MQRLVKMSLIIVLMLASTGIVSAQYKIKGHQTRGVSGRNAELRCKEVSIDKKVKIKAVSGKNAGFWIMNKKGKKFHFGKSNDKSAIGFVLVPGIYRVYPNLRRNSNKATVVLLLE